MADSEERQTIKDPGSISEMKKQAMEFLNSRYFYAASDQFKKILEIDNNDKDAHMGVLMADNKVLDEERLIKHYQDLYSIEESEIKLACDIESDHIEEMAEKAFLPGYLDKDEIRKIYDFDVSFRSVEFCRKKQKDEILKEIDQNEHLAWLKRNGFKEIGDILSVYDRRLEEAKSRDRENIQKIRNDYQRFLYKTYSDVKQLSAEAKERKENDYQKLIEEFEASKDIEEVKKLSYRFEQFKDYKEGNKYIGLCEEKIDQLKKEEDDKTFHRVIDNSLVAARASLVTGKFGEAFEAYSKILSMEPENEEAHLGVLMARTKTSDTQQLYEYYRDLYNSEDYEILEACEEDREYIEEMAEKYSVPDYLDKETIYEKYTYDRSYRSLSAARIKQEKQFNEDVSSDPIFGWLKRKGSDETKKQIKSIFDAYSARVEEARKEDKRRSEEIRNDYQRFLFKTYASIKKSFNQANEKKEEAYRQILHRIELSDNEEELKELIERLQELGSYKESDDYILVCRKKIKELKSKEESETLAQDIETALIAARAYLSTGNTGMADKNFERVLSMDPDNPRAYLGILMIETGTKDIDELSEYYLKQYSEDEPKVLEACKEESAHIDEAVKQYSIPSYLEQNAIERYYVFDRHYESLTASRIRQKELFDEEIKMNPLLNKIVSADDPDVLRFLEKTRNGFDARIVESRKADERQIESIRHIYEVYIEESDKTLKMVYEEKRKEKAADDEAVYRRNVEEFSRELNEEELEDLSRRFDPEYKDGAKYIEECTDRILSLRKTREREKLDSLAKEGTELLECRLFDDAKQRFVSYLEIDPLNEDIYLKLLMADKKVADKQALFDFYKELYLYDIPETKEAIEEATDHIEEVCEKCYIPEQFEKYEIRKRYAFDRKYESLVNCRTIQKRQIEDEVRLDPSLSWLKQNGSDEVKDEIQDVLDTYELRLLDAIEEDNRTSDTISKEYKAFVRNTDREVRSLYSGLIKESNRKRKEAYKEQKELERKQKEEAKKEKQEAERLKKEEEEKKKEELLAKQRTETEQKAQLEALKNQEKEKKKIEADLRRIEEEKQRLEKQAKAKAEKEKRKEKRAEAFSELISRKGKEETKATVQTVTPVVREKKPSTFRPNLALLVAAASLIVLAYLVYTLVYVPSNKYNHAVSLANTGNYDEAISIFEELGDYKDSAYQAKSVTYQKADSLYKNGQIIDAAMIFNNLRFDDSEDRVKTIKKEIISNAEIGDSVYFGDYEQDGNTDNGKEMVEWIVLDQAEGSILVISKNVLDARAFNDTSGEVYWENSSLRSWLNGRFPDNAFSKENPSDVLSTTVENTRYPESEEEEENIEEIVPETYETRDRLFLLSYDELAQYYPNEGDRECIATEYAIENGVRAGADGSCSWWLRTPGNDRTEVSYVWNEYGSVASSPQMIMQGIRPAMWLKAE